MKHFNYIPNNSIKLKKLKNKYEDAIQNGILVIGEINKIDTEGNMIIDLVDAKGFVSKEDVFIDNVSSKEFNTESNYLLFNNTSYFLVKEVTIEDNEIVLKLDRKQAMEKIRSEIVHKVSADDIITGRVKSIQPYAAFLDIGGDLTGILHQNNINIKTSMNFIKKGDSIDVKVLSFDKDILDIEFEITDLKDPWDNLDIKAGDKISGIIRSYLKKGNRVNGVFIELIPGVEGLLSLDGLDDIKFNKLSLSFVIGNKIPVRVVKVDPSRRRIKLGVIL